MNPAMSEYLQVVGDCGKKYLATGGPTSRLEEKIVQSGQSLGYNSQIYATPTAMFVSVQQAGEIVTSLEVVPESTMNFTDMLYYDSVLDRLSSGSLTLRDARERLLNFKSKKYVFPLVTISSFLVGFMASFPKYGSWVAAIGSGIITSIVYLLNRPLARKLQLSGVFTDFIGCLVAFILALVAGTFFELPIPAFVIGAVILIVPGLTLTSAISELAEHHFVSGTVKMMKSILILVAMGVSYLLVENMLVSYGMSTKMLVTDLHPSGLIAHPWFQVVCRIILLTSFCVFFHIPLRAFPGAIFCGLASILMLDQFKDPKLFVLASFSASLVVGLVSLTLARIYNWPSQVFSTPGILALVPGLLALSTFYSLSDSSPQGLIAYRVALTAGAITFGLFTARMPFRFYNSLRNLPVTR